MSGRLRREVLSTFKKLHRTRLNTFRGDRHGLEVARKRINEEYTKYKTVTDDKLINELNEFAKAVEKEVRTTVIQAKEVEPGTFEVSINPDIEKLDNVQFDELACSTAQKSRNFKGRKCSDYENTAKPLDKK